MIKESVVVSTCCPGNGLNRLIRCFDAETLSASEGQMTIVDDDSPHNTLERLQALAPSLKHATP